MTVSQFVGIDLQLREWFFSNYCELRKGTETVVTRKTKILRMEMQSKVSS